MDVVEERVDVGDRTLVVIRPPDAEALLDEEAFEDEEFLPYWAELWPSSVALADHVAQLPLEGQSVLELGCGLGLPSVAAALAGARVLATDWSPEALEFTVRNATRNGVRLEAMPARWDEPDLLLARGRFELVLAADVLYERRNGDQLLELLPRVVADGGEALVADPGRPHATRFLKGAADWVVETLPSRHLPRGGIHRLAFGRRTGVSRPTPS